MSQIDWLESEINKDIAGIQKHKNKLIDTIISVDKKKVSNTILERETKKESLLWRLKKVLGM